MIRPTQHELPIAPNLARYLARQVPAAHGSVVWGKAGEERWPLAVTAYLTEEPPPLHYVTSVRALVYRGDALLTMEDEAGLHIMPGGRCEPGEAPEETLRREVLEESGWTLHIGPLLGVIRFRHRGRKPQRPPDPAHRDLYPDFLNMVYLAEADAYDSALLLPSASEPEPCRLFPIAALPLERLDAAMRVFLEAALARRPVA